jgi:hypothetical protein
MEQTSKLPLYLQQETFILKTARLMEKVCIGFSLQCLFHTIFAPFKCLVSYIEDGHRNAGHVKCPLLLSDFNPNWNVLTNVSKTGKSTQTVLEFLHANE